MTELTDKNIIIQCSECKTHTEQGLNGMVRHIRSQHANYTRSEAETYAAMWMEDAYQREENWERNATERERRVG